ncbi:MAG: hypothetical protein V1758_01075 [Pseudomonadota bacterium]
MVSKRLGKEGLISDATFRPLKKKRYSDQIAELIQERIFVSNGYHRGDDARPLFDQERNSDNSAVNLVQKKDYLCAP